MTKRKPFDGRVTALGDNDNDDTKPQNKGRRATIEQTVESWKRTKWGKSRFGDTAKRKKKCLIMRSEFSLLQIKGRLLGEQRVTAGWKLSKGGVHALRVCTCMYMCICGFRFVFSFASAGRQCEVILMNGLQGCNLSLSMSRRPMTSSAVLTCAALHVCLPREKKHRLLGNGQRERRLKEGKTASSRWPVEWKTE